MSRNTASNRQTLNPNLIKNGNFESAPTFVAATTANGVFIDGTATGSATNDTYFWGTSKSGTIEAYYDSVVKHSGSYSLKLSTKAAASYIESHHFNNVSSAAKLYKYGVRVLPSTQYVATYWMKTNYVSGDSAGGGKVQFVERQGDNTSVIANSPVFVKTTTDWTQYSVTFTTNANTRYIDLSCIVHGHNGTATLVMDAWFDDISITPVTSPSRTASTTRKPLSDNVSDTFTRADSVSSMGQTEIGALTWTPVTGTWGISSNQAYLPSATANAFTLVETGHADVEIELTVAVYGNEPAIYFRSDGTTHNYWRLIRSGTSLLLQKETGSLATAITKTITVGVSDTYGVKAKGDIIEIYVNGALRGSIVDSSNNDHTKHGLGNGSATNSNVTRFDNFNIKYI